MTTTKTNINLSLSLAVLVIGLGSALAMASERNAEYMEACKPEVNQFYGRDMDVQVVDKRRVPAGVQVKLAAKTDSDNADFLNCWIPNGDVKNSGFDQFSNSLAVTVEPVPVIR